MSCAIVAYDDPASRVRFEEFSQSDPPGTGRLTRELRSSKTSQGVQFVVRLLSERIVFIVFVVVRR